MTKLELYNKLNIEVNSMKKKGKVIIINNQYVSKPMSRKSNFYEYLQTRNFNYFPNIYSDISDDIELMDYIEEKEIPDEQKLEDIIYLASILHLSTTFVKNVDLDKIKEIYENTIDRIDRLFNYYNEMQNMIEEEIYMSPANYLLIRNISDIYKCLNLSKDYINDWYKEKENNKTIRYVYTHSNLRKEHLLENDKMYLISWDNSKIDMPIKDIEIVYRNSFYDIDIFNLLNIYEKKYPLKKEEKFLLFSYLLIPIDITFSENEFIKTEQITELVEYQKKILESLENYSKETNNNTYKQNKDK